MKKMLKSLAVLVAIVVVGLVTLGLVIRDKVEIPAGYEGKYVNVEHVRVRYVQKGTGPDLLLIHGTPASIEEWQPVIDDWAKRYRVTAYDRPGHGYSDPPQADTGIEYNARIAHALMAELQLRDALVVGHSYGGAIALRLAVDGETRAAHYAIVDSTVFPSDRKPMAISRLLRLPLLGRGFAVLLQYVGGRVVDDGLKEAFHPEESQIPPGYSDAKKSIWLQPKVTLAVAQEMTSFDGEIREMTQRYPDIKKPVLVVAGSADRPWIVEGATRLTQVAPTTTTLAIVQGSGHMVQFTHADDLTKLIDAAMKR